MASNNSYLIAESESLDAKLQVESVCVDPARAHAIDNRRTYDPGPIETALMTLVHER